MNRNNFGFTKVLLVLISFSLLSGNRLFSGIQNEALEYMNIFTKEIDTIQIQIWDYVKNSAHNSNIAQIEDKRKTLLESVGTSINTIQKVKPYKGDNVLKKATLKYLYTLGIVIKEDYGKIVNMEEIAENSYDLMEAYILAKEKAKEKLNEAADELIKKQKVYATENNIKLIFTDSKISQSLKKANKVMNYFNSIYLIFFKSNKQEIYLLDAFNISDLNKIEQSRLTLIKYAQGGLKKLKSIKKFDNDSTVKESCKVLLNFYYTEASGKVLVMIDFLMKKEMFEKIKKAFDLKEDSERTQTDIDLYNSKVKEMNEAAKKYNETNKMLNAKRRELINNWNEKCQTFFHTHVPR